MYSGTMFLNGVRLAWCVTQSVTSSLLKTGIIAAVMSVAISNRESVVSVVYTICILAPRLIAVVFVSKLR